MKARKKVDEGVEEVGSIGAGAGVADDRIPRSQRLTRQKLRRDVNRRNQPMIVQRAISQVQFGRRTRSCRDYKGERNVPIVMRKNESHSEAISPRTNGDWLACPS